MGKKNGVQLNSSTILRNSSTILKSSRFSEFRIQKTWIFWVRRSKLVLFGIYDPKNVVRRVRKLILTGFNIFLRIIPKTDPLKLFYKRIFLPSGFSIFSRSVFVNELSLLWQAALWLKP
jgi:hypothetical protein